MNDSEIGPGERVKDVQFTEDTIAVDLVDGRTIVVPLAPVQARLRFDGKRKTRNIRTTEQRIRWRNHNALTQEGHFE